jgi:hypothetical protein
MNVVNLFLKCYFTISLSEIVYGADTSLEEFIQGEFKGSIVVAVENAGCFLTETFHNPFAVVVEKWRKSDSI